MPVLIGLLADRAPVVRKAAENGLETLTHRSFPLTHDDPGALQRPWTRWWLRQGSEAPVYDTAHCAAATPLE